MRGDLGFSVQDILALLREYGAQLALAVIGVLAIWFRDQIFRFVRLIWHTTTRLRRAEQAIKDDAPWLLYKPRTRQELSPSQIPILTIANLKGGVGKTTLSANLAGYFVNEAQSVRRPAEKFRVLLIDLDFQGSLSSMVLPIDHRLPQAGRSKASRLLIGELSSESICEAPVAIDSNRIQAIPAYYDLARVETRTFMEWLLQTFQKDLRYILHDALRDPAVQSRYDLVIIDAPPRLTTASVQALCASTHVLIPTKLDKLSGDAVGTFFDQMEELRPLWPSLKFVGVAGMMVSQNPDTGNPPSETEQDAEQVVRVAVQTVCSRRNLEPPASILLDRMTYISDTEQIRQHSGEGIAYLRLAGNAQHVRVRSMINRLGQAVRERIQ